ncbi:MAG: TraR/DksA C4-type zinc finger protein [Patescibacteria group bacterium]
MDKQKIEDYKKQLEREKLRLLAELNKTEKGEDYGSDVDIDEETDEAESFSEGLAIGQGLRERINEIDLALKRIQNGKFGLCENCGKEIEEDILKISPESKLCKNCKRKNHISA